MFYWVLADDLLLVVSDRRYFRQGDADSALKLMCKEHNRTQITCLCDDDGDDEMKAFFDLDRRGLAGVG